MYKYWISILAGLVAYFTPLKEVFLLVGCLVIADFFTGITKALKTKTFSSAKAIQKFWVSFGYFVGIIVAKSLENYLHQDILVKPMVMVIAISEVQSLRENIQVLTNVDILKPIANLFNKKP
jgi:phage-related holin